MNQQKLASAFYFGTFLSSVGNMTFTLLAVTFMLKASYTLSDVALLVGLSRFFPLLTTALLGHLADQIHPKRIVLFSEIIALTLSLGILLAWNIGRGGYLFFVGLVVLRACVMSIQNGGRAKIAKILSDSTYASNAKNAIWLNKVTQGATFFAGILGWLAGQLVSFEYVIAFDSLTFLANGVILWTLPSSLLSTLPMPLADKNINQESMILYKSFIKKFSDFYEFASSEAKLDWALAIAMCGFWSLSARTAEIVQISPSYFLISFGAAVWLSGSIERAFPSKFSDEFWWSLLALGFASYSLVQKIPLLMITSAFTKDLAYWMLFHRLSTRIQLKSPEAKMAGIASARFFQIVATLSLGEFAVGAWQKVIPLSAEAFLRSLVCTAVLFVLMKNEKTRREVHEILSSG